MRAMSDQQPSDADQPQAPTLHEPADGVPPVCDTPEALADVASAFRSGTGSVALDAERASGHRYGQRAFLVQAKRLGSGIALIDPEALDDLTPFAEAIDGAEWILHAATQDLACLADVGLRPQRLFDTELAGRLLNLPKVGLASLTESLLGWHLAKGHSAADWSVRPLPDAYLRYAALDVELLHELRDVLEGQLRAAGKWAWAEQEFEALTTWQPNVHADPWRRTSGINKLRDRRSLATLRSLWQARDSLAQDLDLAPGRVLPDTSLVAAAADPPDHRRGLLSLPGFKRQQRRLGVWWDALLAAADEPESGLPALRPPASGPPPPRSWSGRHPDAAKRFAAARGHVLDVAELQDLPPEILISPDVVRRLAWSPPDPTDQATVAEAMAGRGARQWQIDLLAPGLAAAISAG